MNRNFTPDISTVFANYLVISFVSILVLIFLWKQNHRRYRGTGIWISCFSLQGVAMILFLLRGLIPDWASVVLSNTLVMTGLLFGLIGLERFAGKERRHHVNIILITLYTLAQVYFTYFQPDLSARKLLFSFVMLALALQSHLFAVAGAGKSMRKYVYVTGMVYGVFSVINVLRIIKIFTDQQPDTDFLKTNNFEFVFILFYQLLFFFLTFTLVLMYNKRALSDMSVQEEKFKKAFHTSPYAMLVSSLKDGKIIEVNSGFTKMSGFSASEVLGSTLRELKIYGTDDERVKLVSELLLRNVVKEKELNFLRKDGEIVTALISAEIIYINNEEFIISSINDITERKKAEEKAVRSAGLYKSLFNNMINGFAYCRMQYDENNDPCDFTYLSVNEAFENLTGLNNVTGRKVTEMIPGIGEHDRKLLNAYGRVASGGAPERFEIYLESLNMWFHISVYSPEKGYFVSLFDVINDRKTHEKRIIDQVNELERLNRIMIGRENRMIELKSEVNDLCGMLEIHPIYTAPEDIKNQTSV